MAGFRLLASVILGTLGLYFLYRGKKTESPRLMIWGAGLLVLSYLVYF